MHSKLVYVESLRLCLTVLMARLFSLKLFKQICFFNDGEGLFRFRETLVLAKHKFVFLIVLFAKPESQTQSNFISTQAATSVSIKSRLSFGLLFFSTNNALSNLCQAVCVHLTSDDPMHRCE